MTDIHRAQTPKRRWPILLAVLLLAAAGAGAYLLWPRTLNVTGVVALNSSDLDTEGQVCKGKGGFSDLAEGASLVVTDGSGETVALARLGQGKWSATNECTFPFAVEVPAGHDIYGVTVGNRGGAKFAEAELAQPIKLTLGR